jgi:hypothetical protein
MRERTFTRGQVTVTTTTPARATQLIAEGWEEVNDWPTERPEPTHRFERENGEIVDAVEAGPNGPSLTVATNATGTDEPVDSRSARRRRAASETGEMPPTPTE